MIIRVKVKTSSGRQGVVKEDENHFVVSLKSPPENNRANAELAKLLHNYFKAEVRIKSGLTSRNKIVEVT